MERDDIVAWEQRLKALFDEIDDRLEDRYGPLFSVHPSRPRRGSTASKEQDGLFNVGASFSAGYGSRLGRGYVVDIDVLTLDTVPPSIRRQIEDDVHRLIVEKLALHFPDRDINADRDGNVIKIHGDLSFRKK
jgi:hypothetical protein